MKNSSTTEFLIMYPNFVLNFEPINESKILIILRPEQGMFTLLYSLFMMKYRNFGFIHFQFLNLKHRIKCAKTQMIDRFKNLNPSFLNPLQSVRNYKRQISEVSITLNWT